MTERSDFHFLQDASDFLRINEHILRLYKKIFFKERKSIKKNLLELRMTHIPRQQEASGCKAALGKAASPHRGRARESLSALQSSGKPAAAPGLDLWHLRAPRHPSCNDPRDGDQECRGDAQPLP